MVATERQRLDWCWGGSPVGSSWLVPGRLYYRMCACAVLAALDALAAMHHGVAIEAQLPPDDEWAGVIAKSRG